MIRTATWPAIMSVLLGHWTKGSVAEHWVPVDRCLVGVGFAPGREGPSFEVLTIREQGNAFVYEARPRGGAAVPFPLATVTDTTLVFLNPEHDDPQRIRYARAGSQLEVGIGAAEGPERATFRMDAQPVTVAWALESADRAAPPHHDAIQWTTRASGWSPTGELGFTVGAWVGKNGGGTYVRIWEPAADGAWTIRDQGALCV